MRIVPSFWHARFVMIGGDGVATSVLWWIGVEAFPSCLVVMATTTILYSVKGPKKRFWPFYFPSIEFQLVTYAISWACNNEFLIRSAFHFRGRFWASRDGFDWVMCSRCDRWDSDRLVYRARATKSWLSMMSLRVRSRCGDVMEL